MSTAPAVESPLPSEISTPKIGPPGIIVMICGNVMKLRATPVMPSPISSRWSGVLARTFSPSTSTRNSTRLSSAAICLALPAWQFVRMFSRVGMQGWTPGPGMVLTLGGAVLAGVAAWQLWSHRRVDGPTA